MPIKRDRTINDHKHVQLIETETVDDNVSAMSEDKMKIERIFKPITSLSVRHKRERLSEINCLIANMEDPVPIEKDEHVDQCAYVTEDVLNELHKTKGSKSKIFNNDASEIDSCGSLQVADSSMIDEKLSSTLGKELSSFSHSKVRKAAQEGKIRLAQRQSLSNKKDDTACEGFTMEWNDTEIGNDGCNIFVELENHECKISCVDGIQ